MVGTVDWVVSALCSNITESSYSCIELSIGSGTEFSDFFLGVTAEVVLVKTSAGFSYKKEEYPYYFQYVYFPKRIHIVLFSLLFILFSYYWALVSLGFIALGCFEAFLLAAPCIFYIKILILWFTYVIEITNYRQTMFFNNCTRLYISTSTSTGTEIIIFISVKLWRRHAYTFLMYICKSYLFLV